MQVRVVLIGTLVLGLVALGANAQTPTGEAADESIESLLGAGEPTEAAADGEAPPLLGEPAAGSPLAEESELGSEPDALAEAPESDAMAGEIDSELGQEWVETEPAVSDATAEPSGADTASIPELGPIGYDEQGQQGRIHIVVPGDTLWDISEAYLGTPWVWPSIWESNPAVANPHRIYPEDRIWITPSQMRRVTPEEAEALLARVPDTDFETTPPPAAVEEILDAMPVAPTGRSFRYMRNHAAGYVSAEAYDAAAEIVDSPSPHAWLAQTRRVYVGLGEGEVGEGDRFAVMRAREEVSDPASGKRIGFLVESLGMIEITGTDAETSEAMIRVSNAEMERGDRILPYHLVEPEIPLRDAPAGVEGQVAHFGTSRTVMADADLVFLNRGSEDGVEVGNTLEVYRSGDQVQDNFRDRKVKLPDQVIADVIVIRSEPTTATAVVTRSKEEIERGDWFRAAAE